MGATWSNLIWPILAWWLALSLLGWAAVPFARRLLGALGDQGLGFARPLGLLAAAYLYWLGGVTGLVPNTAAGAWAVALAVSAGGAWLGWRDRAELGGWLRAHRRLVVGYEALFLAALVLWALYRAYNPNIETAGGEKYMEMAFINGILASTRFPPNDPWMAGQSISYYYFGYVMSALLIRLTGVLPWVGFSLVVPGTLAMVLCGAFSLGYNLVGLASGATWRARVAVGGLTGLLLAGVGSLAGFLEVAYLRGWGSPAFWDWLDVKNLTVGNGSCAEPGQGYGMGSWLPTRFIWWWRGSRVIHDQCGEVIHEFPFFSFMLADAHPHLLDLPFVLLVLGLALAMLSGRFWGADRPLWSPRWLALPAIVGALGFLNAWDLPTFAFVLVVAYGLIVWRRPVWDTVLTPGDRLLAAVSGVALLAGLWRLTPALLAAVMERLSGTAVAPSPWPTRALAVVLWALALYGVWALWRRARAGDVVAARALDVGRFTIWLAVLALLFYLPFHLGFRSQVTGIGMVGVRSRLPQWLVHFGLLAFLGTTLVALFLPVLRRARPGPMGMVVGVAGVALALASVALQAWTALVLVVLMVAAALAGLATWRAGAAEPADEGEVGGATVAATFALLCLTVGLLMPLGTEFLFIRDLFGSRMNTVFKLFFQAWVLLSVAGGFTFYAAWRRLSRPALVVWGVLATVLVAASLVYPVAAVYNRTSSFTPPTYGGRQGLTLDGLAWWRDQHPDDVAAAEWLRANARGTPVILEAPGGGYSHNGRISLATGFPTVMGWDGHEHQWRGVRDAIDPQKADAIAMYTTPDAAELARLLEKYDVRYVVVGELERGQTDLDIGDADMARFERVLRPVFTSGRTVIYERQ